ncbi:MAG: ferritin-like domain-containing protein [Deltaproteobacteria bacterium]|nr:ferritin-like domain-containing protein [Deltaproteobacteria bacterium]
MRRVKIGTDEKLFRSMHRRYCDDLHELPAWDRFDASALEDSVREELRRAWSARVVAEYRSMVVFSELIARMPEAGLSLEVSCAASRLLQDEARHTELCQQIAERLGGTDDALVDVKRDLHLADENLRAELFVARWTVSMFCVGECASVGLLQALVDEGKDPCVSRVLETLLRDEILHDRFGWALARSVIPTLTDDEREWLSADLAFSFAHYDRVNGRGMRAEGGEVTVGPARSDGAERMGLIAPSAYAQAWYTRLDTVIMPSLRGLGLAANEAWMLRHEAAASQR